MIRIFSASAALALAGCAANYEPPRQPAIARADVVPLALGDDFALDKVSTFFNDPRDPRTEKPTANPMIQFERQRVNYGAVSGYDRAERYGHYFTIWWRAKRQANVTLRLEYRQENTGSHVQAKELSYPAAQGAMLSKFTVIGDDYREDGKVTAWRLLVIENGRAVALRQSFLWN